MSAYLDLPRRTEAETRVAVYISRLDRLAKAYNRSAQRYENNPDPRDVRLAGDFRMDELAIRWALAEREALVAALEEVRHYTAQGNPADAHEVACCAIGTEGKT